MALVSRFVDYKKENRRKRAKTKFEDDPARRPMSLMIDDLLSAIVHLVAYSNMI